MKHIARGLIVLIWVVGSLVACAPGAGDGAALAEKTWHLVSYGAPDAPQAVLDGSEITLSFDDDESQIGGRAGCNHYFGSYEIKGEGLSIGAIGITEMACMSPEGVMEQEQTYVAALSSASRYEVQADQLRITGADGQVLVFRATDAGS